MSVPGYGRQHATPPSETQKGSTEEARLGLLPHRKSGFSVYPQERENLQHGTEK